MTRLLGASDEEYDRAGSEHVLDDEITPLVHVALCDRDDCAWKHRGVTALATTEAAQAHSRSAGHSVSLYEDHEKVGGTMPWHPGSEEAEAERLSIEGRIRELERAVKILLGALHDPGRPVLTESQYRTLYERLGRAA